MKKIATIVVVAASLASPPVFAKGLNLGLGAGVGVATSGLLNTNIALNPSVAANVTGLGAVTGKNGLLGKNGLVGSLLSKGLTVGVGASAAACGC